MLQEIFARNALSKEDVLMGLEVHRAVLEAGLVGHDATERRTLAATCRPPGRQWEEDGLTFAEFAGKIVPGCRATLSAMRHDKLHKLLAAAPREWTGRVQKARLLEACLQVLPAEYLDPVEDGEGALPGNAVLQELIRLYSEGAEGYSLPEIALKLQAISEDTPRSIFIVLDLAADVASADGRQAVATRLAQLCGEGGGPLSCVVHNAAVIGELCNVDQLTLAGYQRTMAINVEGPLFLTQALKPSFSSGSRVLHISSGAAHRPLEGCLTYCTSRSVAGDAVPG
ncbi:HERC1 [Symbiodinium natans]|uniref:HERC1 protein n=1 Tax=Symbiodinium natans TaxID=878477 RepID=A0A812MHH9_9DINO|nr:HERC1 [Symbiodinium natans]